MTLAQLFRKLRIFTNPYKSLIFYTFFWTLIESFAAQVNAFILKYTVDNINDLMVAKRPLEEGFLTTLSYFYVVGYFF